MSAAAVATAATALFVPGNRSDRFGKAAATGADLVIIDLEDAVPAAHKDEARDAAFRALTGTDLSAAIRINALDDGGAADLVMLSRLVSESPHRLRAVLLPKAEAAADVTAVAAAVAGTPIIPLVETAVGLASSDELARASQVVRLAFGALDFGVDVGATSPTMLDYARCALVVASRLAGLSAPLDSPNPEFRDEDVIRRGAQSARALGFGGQLCIHPLQIPIVAESFLPTDEELAWAERVIAAGDGAAHVGGAVQVDGAMVDKPVLLRAQRILAHRNG